MSPSNVKFVNTAYALTTHENNLKNKEWKIHNDRSNKTYFRAGNIIQT